jgi:hypothetical protein
VKYPLIEKMDLEISKDSWGIDIVTAKDLEAALEKATVVHQDKGYDYWGNEPTCGDRPMKALLICIEEIKKKPVFINADSLDSFYEEWSKTRSSLPFSEYVKRYAKDVSMP